MHEQSTEALEKLRQQYESLPYPQVPLERSPQDQDLDLLFIHNLITPSYLRNQKIVNTTGKTILDAGCGSGYKALTLAQANPGAKIVGIDLSQPSIEFARLRLTHHGHPDAEFHVMPIEDIAALGMQFDYINCDEVLYMVPDPLTCLKALKSVLKPEGIIRGNFHSALQRHNYYRAQSLFKMMGLMDDNPEDMAVELVSDVMQSLKDAVNLKQVAWHSGYETGEDRKERILMNHLIQGDRGFTVPDVFNILQAADLEFISMTNWRYWQLFDLFNDPNDLPMFLALSLPELSVEEQLTLFEIIHPVHRLIDFWCGHSGATEDNTPLSDWADETWDRCVVSLHPTLHAPRVRDQLITQIQEQEPFNFRQFLALPSQAPVLVEGVAAACLLLLFERPQTFNDLVEQWQQWCPVHLVTRKPISRDETAENVKAWIKRLETFLYIMVEQQIG